MKNLLTVYNEALLGGKNLRHTSAIPIDDRQFSELKVDDIMYFAVYLGADKKVDVRSGTILDISSGRISFKTGPDRKGAVDMLNSSGFDSYTLLEGRFTLHQKVFAFESVSYNMKWFYATSFKDLFKVVFKHTYKKIKNKVNE